MKTTECSFENFQKQLSFLQNVMLNIQKIQYSLKPYYLLYKFALKSNASNQWRNMSEYQCLWKMNF